MSTSNNVSVKIREMDITLLSALPQMPEVSINSDVTVREWFEFRKSKGAPTGVLLNLISDTFNIPTIHHEKCKRGSYLHDGFYCVDTDVLYTSSVNDEHFSEKSKLGFFIGDSFGKQVATGLTSESLLLKRDSIQREWSDKGVTSVKFRKGLAFSSYLSREIFLEKVESEVSYWDSPISESFFIGEKLVSQIWSEPIHNVVKRIESGNSQKLFVLSGDAILHAPALFESVLKNNGKYSCQNITSLDTDSEIYLLSEHDLCNESAINKACEIISTGSAYVVFFSAAKNIIELFPKLESFLSIRQILMQLASHDIRVGLPKLCPSCCTLGAKTTPSNIALEFNLDAREYMIQGDGCSSCVDGIHSVHILKESAFKDDNVYKAISESQANKDKRLEPYIILKEFRKAEVPSIYTSLGSALTHGEIQVLDAKGVLI